MTDGKKTNSRFNILSQATEGEILNTKENNNADNTASPQSTQQKEESSNTESLTGLKFNQTASKTSKKDKKRKDDQIKDRATINVSEPTRTRLKIFCATHKFVLQNWADEILWKAMDKHEKALKESKERKE